MQINRIATTMAGLLLAGSITAWAQAQDAAQQTNQPPKWDKSAALGLTLTRGNSDTFLGTANILATRKAGKNEYNLGADATYGENDGKRNAANVHGFGQYNRLITDRAFVYARLEALNDAQADLRYRLIFSPGAGYYFIKTVDATLRGELGPSFIYENQRRGDPPRYDTKGYMTVRIAERYDHKLSDRVKIWQMVEFLPQVDDFENYLINGEVGLDTSITPKLSLRTYLQDTYDNKPAPGRKKNDLKLVTAIAYKF